MHRTASTLQAMNTKFDADNSASEQSINALMHFFIFLMPVACGLVITLVLPLYGMATAFGGTGHDGYLELARSLYNGDGYRFSADGPAVFHRPPLYPLLLAPLMGLSLPLLKTAVVIQNSLFLFAACVYARRISNLLFPQRAVGLIAMLLLICNPWTLRLVSSPLSAVMQMALYSALSFYFLQFCAKYREFGQMTALQLARSFSMTFLLTTAMCFAHGTSIYVCAAVFVVAVALVVASKEWKLLAFLTVTAMLTLIALSPWTVRNEALLDRLEPSASGAGFTYFLGNSYWAIDVNNYWPEQSIEMNSLLMGGVDKPQQDSVDYWGITDAGVDQQLRQAMVDHLVANPLSVLKKSLLNLSDIYFPITHPLFCRAGGESVYCEQSTNRYEMTNRIARSALMLFILGLAAAYLRTSRHQRPVLAWLAVAGAVLHTLPYLPIATYAHHGIYSLGALPLLSPLAAGMLYRLRLRYVLRNAKPVQLEQGAIVTVAPPTFAADPAATTAQWLRRDNKSQAVIVDYDIG